MFSWKYRIHAILILSVLAIIFVPMYTNKPDKNKTDASVAAATEFLQMVDAGRYDDSWQITDPFLQKKVPLQDWQAKLKNISETFGPVAERSLDNVSFTAPTAELPESEFIMLEYETRFEKKEMKEAVTLVLGNDNRWRVVGYFIQ